MIHSLHQPTKKLVTVQQILLNNNNNKFKSQLFEGFHCFQGSTALRVPLFECSTACFKGSAF